MCFWRSAAPLASPRVRGNSRVRPQVSSKAPLRERDGDLYALVTHFLRELTPPGSTVASMTPRAWRALSAYTFPGNVRELAMTLEHALALSRGSEIDAAHLPRDITGTAVA